MRFWSLALLLGCLVLAAPLQAETNLRLLTYNIHRDIGGSDSNTSSQPSLAKVVNYLNPDLWTINELGGNNVTFNATTAHNYLVTFIQQFLTIFGPNPQENINYFIYISSIDDGFDTVAIVSRYPFASTQSYSDANDGYSSERGLARASISLTDGNTIDVFTAHLKANGSTSDAAQRQSEADLDSSNAANWISTHHGDAIALTGDWNETEDSGETANWSGHNIGDTLTRRPREPYHPITTMRSAGVLDPKPLSIAGRQDTIDSTTPDARFDYTMYFNCRYLSGQVFDTKQYTSAQLAALNSAAGTNFVAGDSASASDHLPVFSVLKVGFPPDITGITGGGGNTIIGYQALLSPFVTYTIEESVDLAHWTTIAASDQVLSQTPDTETVQSTVAAGNATTLFLRVRPTVN